MEAPVNQVVDIKFQSLTLETHRDCRYDWIAVYDGVQLNDTQLLGRFCGNFTYQLPRMKSRGQQAIIQFKTDWSVSHGGFSAAVRFTSGPNQGCGGLLNLTTGSGNVQLRAPDAALSPVSNGGELDCQWTVLAPPTKVVRLQFTQLEMSDSGCSEDFIEARDGSGESASLMGRYCGSVPPPALIASGNAMWVRQVTGTSGRRANFVATISYQDTPCGSAGLLDATDSRQVLTSPNFPLAAGANLRCRWVIDGNSTAVQVHFQQMAIGDSGPQCTGDRIEIQDVIEVNFD